MRKSFLLLAIFLTVPAQSQARLGETRDQCRERYGQPQKVEEPTSPESAAVDEIDTFKKSGFTIEVGYLEKKAVIVVYEKIAKSSQGTPLKLSQDERTFLLSANGGDLVWHSGGSTSLLETWWTAEPSLIALEDKKKGSLTFTTPAQLTRIDEAKYKKATEHLEGF